MDKELTATQRHAESIAHRTNTCGPFNAMKTEESQDDCVLCKNMIEFNEVNMVNYNYCACGQILERRLRYIKHCVECGREVWRILFTCGQRGSFLKSLLSPVSWATHNQYDGHYLIKTCEETLTNYPTHPCNKI